MTDKLKRLLERRDSLIKHRDIMMRSNNLYGMEMTNIKIAEVDKAIEDARMYEPMKLGQALSHDEMLKNEIYKKLLKCSLAADFLNDCCEDVRGTLKQYGISDVTFIKEAKEICRKSQEIASLCILPGQKPLTEMMTDNEDFLDVCHDAAEKHLNERLGL